MILPYESDVLLSDRDRFRTGRHGRWSTLFPVFANSLRFCANAFLPYRLLNSGNHAVRRISNDVVSTLAGSSHKLLVADWDLDHVRFQGISDLAFYSHENALARSTAALSSTTIQNPTFTGDVADQFTFLHRAEGPTEIRHSTVNVDARQYVKRRAVSFVSSKRVSFAHQEQ